MAVNWQQLGLLLQLASVLLFCVDGISGKRTKEKIYIDMASKNACYRLMNATHQIGCSSDYGGSTGVVHYMQSEADWNFVVKEGGTAPYVAVLDLVNFTATNVRRLVKSGRVSGIAVISVNLTTDTYPEGFSMDKSCPNDAYGMYHGTSEGACSQVKWNLPGEGLMFDDFTIPVFSITEQSDVDSIITQCWERFNKPKNGQPRTYPLCSMELSSFMDGAKDSETCMRRSSISSFIESVVFCDPLGDDNVVATLKAASSKEGPRPPKSVVVVATRVDTMGLFLNEYPSGDTTASGVIALLATAKALWSLRDVIESQTGSRDIMFAFFQGEAFDYIGSSRMIYEMQSGHFPVDFSDDDSNVNLQRIEMKHIYQFVELSQVGMRQDEDSLWLHVDPTVMQRTSVSSSLTKLIQFGSQSGVTFKTSNPTHPLPPASVQRFLMEAGESSLPSFVVTDHKDSFTNKYYNSRLDLPSQIEANYTSDLNATEKYYNSRLDLPSQIEANYTSDLNATEKYDTNTTLSERIVSTATALARYLFWVATGNDPTADQLAKLQGDINEVNHMVYCFLHSPQCELFNASISPGNADSLKKNTKPFPFYVSVKTSISNPLTYLIQRVLAHYTGEVVADATEGDCKADQDKRYNYYWMQGDITSASGERTPVCYKSTVLLSSAKSPAFEIDDYAWQSGRYSTWTESRWADNIGLRIFLVPSKQFEVLTLVVGVSFLAGSLIAVFFINSSADVLFKSPEPDAAS